MNAATKKAPREGGRMGDDAVQAKTGKTWAEWFATLDKAGARKMIHREIATHLSAKHKCPGWWCQMITVYYEQARGMRVPHQTAEGFSANGSRTLSVGLPALYRAWADEKERRRWLPDSRLEIRGATPKRSLRIVWGDGKSRLDVMFFGKGKSKSQVSVDHRRLANAKEAARMKSYWAAALNRLKEKLEA